MATTFDYTKIRNEVEDYVTDEFVNYFDIDGVMDELSEIARIAGYAGRVITSIDDIDIDVVLQRHDIRGL